ncbi:MAG: hypothetical protein QOE04_1044 [Mycobacterium sp.]|jgi:hypothetical protein|nr:hypothetical protein [Mycobacterium sp.]MDT5402683.1 hypothetical protein [Mycobacterium sp.]
MKLAAMQLTQRDGVTCGPAVAVVAGALLDPAYRAKLTGRADKAVGTAGRVWFAGEQGRVHTAINRVWPRRFGATPMGVARAISVHSARYGVRYRWRSWWGRRDQLADVLAAVDAHWPVGMLVGNYIPRHWVLVVERSGPDVVRCYEPTSGQVRSVELAAIRGAELTNVGFPRPFAFVVPKAPHSNI